MDLIIEKYRIPDHRQEDLIHIDLKMHIDGLSLRVGYIQRAFEDQIQSPFYLLYIFYLHFFNIIKIHLNHRADLRRLPFGLLGFLVPYMGQVPDKTR